MKKFLTGIFAALALCSFSIAQDATPADSSPTTPQAQQNSAPTTAASANSKIAPGSIIPVQLTKSIDAKKIKSGDLVEAKVTQDMKAGNGEIIVPKDTKVMGRVTEAQARNNKEQKESQVAITFDHAIMKTGGDVNLPMSIQAIIAPSYLSANNNPGNADTGQSQSNSAATAGGMPQSNNNSHAGGMGRSQSPTSAPDTGTGAPSTENKAGTGAHQPITGETQGVLGIPDLTLSSASPAQGSVITSEKNNVKLESGTLMLLKVTGASQ